MSKTNKNAFLFAFIVSIGGFIFGLDIMLISGTFQYTTIEFGLSSIQKGHIAAAPNYGALVALFFAGYFCEKLGRKRTLMIIAALYTISAIGSAFAPSYTALFLARLIGGLAFTSLSLAAMYIGEIAPPSMRGKLVGLNQLNIAIGILVATILNFYLVELVKLPPEWANAIALDKDTVWRWMLGIEIIPAIAWFILLFLIPESPRWLMLNDKFVEAEKVIHRITDKELVETEIKRIRDSLRDTHHSVGMIEQGRLLFHRHMRAALFIGICIAVFQGICGINAVLAFMPMIFQQVGGEGSAFLQSIWVSLVGMIFTLLALALIDNLGRRRILLGGLLTCALSMAVVAYGFYDATYLLSAESLVALNLDIDSSPLSVLMGQEFHSDIQFKTAVIDTIGLDKFVEMENDLLAQAANMQGYLVLAGIIVFVCSFNFSLGPILWILFSEIFPTKVRAFAITFCALFATIFGGILVPTLFPWQLSTFGAGNTFFVYMLMSLIGFLVMAKLTPETKGKTIEEIEQAFLSGVK